METFHKYELPNRVSLVLSHYEGLKYATSDDVLADRERLIGVLSDRVENFPKSRDRLGWLELRRDLVAGQPRGAVHVGAAKKLMAERK